MSFIQLQNIVKNFEIVNVLKGINLKIDFGEQCVIRGASGSGKSTLLYLLGGLDRATKGKILIKGENIEEYNDEQLALYRNLKVGFVFQFHFLLPTMNSLDNILLKAQIGNHKVKPIREQSIELAKYLGVEHCLKKFPFELSGGEQQRINLIRALSLKPEILLCDEPTGNLDSENSKKVTELLKTLATEFKSTLIVVTHDERVASQFTRKILIQDGMILN